MSNTQAGAGKRRSILWALFKAGCFVALVAMLALSIVALVMVKVYGKDLPNLDNLTKRQPVVSRVTDRNGIVMCELGSEKRIMTKSGTLPKHVKNAAIAAEDQNFYEHHGFDIKAVIRAGLRFVKTRKFSQGGSTITQQVAKNYVLSREKKISRKVKEVLIAEMIEKKYSKEEILELYFNKVNYGFGRYGIETAARFYFGKSASELSLAEAALLVGLHPSPERYSPRKSMKLALMRRHYVLGRMLAEKMITQAEYASADKEVPQIISDRPTEAVAAQEVCDYVRKFLESKYSPAEMDYLGFTVVTSIDLKLQVEVKNYSREGSAKVAARHRRSKGPEVAAVILDTRTREVLAMVGGAYYVPGGLNRALDAKRQPGSTFKFIGYTAGFAAGAFTPFSIFNGTKIKYDDNRPKLWEPGNYEGEDENLLTVSAIDAFAHSYNTVAVKAICGLGVGVEIVQPVPVAFCKQHGIIGQTIDMAGKLGIQMSDRIKREHNPSLILGTEEVTPIQILNAYATFAADGKWTAPLIITKIIGPNAPELPSRESRVAVEGQTLNWSRSLLRAVVSSGTGRRAEGKLPEDAYGKTGTTSDNSDAWFVGFTDSFAAVVWMGYDSRATKLGRGETGASAALPVWIDSMRAAYGKEGAMVRAMRQKPIEEAEDAMTTLAEPLLQPETIATEPVLEVSPQPGEEAAAPPVDVDEELAKAAARILQEDGQNTPAEPTE